MLGKNGGLLYSKGEGHEKEHQKIEVNFFFAWCPRNLFCIGTFWTFFYLLPPRMVGLQRGISVSIVGYIGKPFRGAWMLRRWEHSPPTKNVVGSCFCSEGKFLCSTKTGTQKYSNSIWKWWMTSHYHVDIPLQISIYLFTYLFLFISLTCAYAKLLSLLKM